MRKKQNKVARPFAAAIVGFGGSAGMEPRATKL